MAAFFQYESPECRQALGAFAFWEGMSLYVCKFVSLLGHEFVSS